MLRAPSLENVQALDLFCGAGGLSYGLKQAGIKIAAGLDLDPRCEYPFERNVGGVFLREDLSKTDPYSLAKYLPAEKFSLLAGCAPCQPFSTLSNGTNRQTSKKWPLLKEFGKVASALTPDLVTMENVPILRSQSIFDEFVEQLKVDGYWVNHKVVDAADYGVPQRRRRLLLIASRLGPIRLVSPAEMGVEPKTVRDAIGHLPPVEAGETSCVDKLHKARSLAGINLERIRASKPGGTWSDWPPSLLLACHKKASGSTFKSVYGRLEWDKPSSTMTTQSYNFGTGRYGHPEQDRSLTLREMAILQSFPPDYEFVKPTEEPEITAIGRLIGNAVPVTLGYVIGKSIEIHLKGEGDGGNVVQ